MAEHIANQLRKGDYCALVVTHSANYQGGRAMERYTRIVLAKVAEASRAGFVRRVIVAGRDYSIEAARLGKVFALVDYQGQAKLLFEATPYAGAEYETKEDFKAALEGAASIVVQPKEQEMSRQLQA